MKARALENAPEFEKNSPAKVVYMGNVTQVTTFQKRPTAPPIRKLNKESYLDLRSGEVCDYEHIENRAGCKDSIRKTLAWIRALINTNVIEPKNCRWVTLTYAENMTDTKRLYEDYKRFWQRFCYWCKANGHGKPEYISVIEPQGRGAWHVHAFFIWDTSAPFIPNEEVLEKLWQQGFTNCKQPTDCDNIGAYFSAYLADLPLDEVEKLPPDEMKKALDGHEVKTVDFTNAQEQTKSKKFVKGGRLYLYPPGMNIVRRSKGIKDPVEEWTTSKKAKEKISSAKLTFSSVFEVLNDDGQPVNKLLKEYYNSKRK